MKHISDTNLDVIANAITAFQIYTDLYQEIHIDSKSVTDQKEVCKLQALVLRELIDGLSVGTDKHPFQIVLEEYFPYCENYFANDITNNAITISWAANSMWESLTKHFPEHAKIKIPA